MERPVSGLIADALGRSALLAGISFLVIAVIGVLLGIVSAIRQNTATDHIIGIVCYFFLSLPEFFWGILLLLFFTSYLGWLPSTGYAPISEGIGNWARHLILPVMTTTFSLIAHVSRMARSSMLEELNSQYIRVARAKGLPERYVILRHALPNALLPTITVLAIDVGILLGGLVVIEMIFSYPGLGRLLIFAIEQKDIPLIQAGMLAITFVYAGANLIADILYATFNPRIRYGSAS
jgi:peptide/nickel transport system permease protein